MDIDKLIKEGKAQVYTQRVTVLPCCKCKKPVFEGIKLWNEMQLCKVCYEEMDKYMKEYETKSNMEE